MHSTHCSEMNIIKTISKEDIPKKHRSLSQSRPGNFIRVIRYKRNHPISRTIGFSVNMLNNNFWTSLWKPDNVLDERMSRSGPKDLLDSRDDSNKVILNNKTIEVNDPPVISDTCLSIPKLCHQNNGINEMTPTSNQKIRSGCLDNKGSSFAAPGGSGSSSFIKIKIKSKKHGKFRKEDANI